MFSLLLYSWEHLRLWQKSGRTFSYSDQGLSKDLKMAVGNSNHKVSANPNLATQQFQCNQLDIIAYCVKKAAYTPAMY